MYYSFFQLLRFDLWQLFFKRNIVIAEFLSGVIIAVAYSLTKQPNVAGEIVQNILFVIHCFGVVHNSTNVFNNDYQDGGLELALTVCQPFRIVLYKLISILSGSILAYILSLSVASLLFSYSYETYVVLLIIGILLMIYSSALSVLVSAIQIYFCDSNVLYMVIAPFLLPALVVCGLYHDSMKINFVEILLGMNMVVVPLCIAFSVFLIKNVYK